MSGTKGRSGNFAKVAEVELKPDGGPLKPRLPDAVGKKWDEMIAQMPVGALRQVDGHQLKILAELLAVADVLSVAAMELPPDHKTIRAFLNVSAQIHRSSSVFGLSPADRKRLAIGPVVSDPDEFQSWMAGRYNTDDGN